MIINGNGAAKFPTIFGETTYDNQVFINCPFDKKYLPLFNVMVFSIIDCGFAPRCSKEVHDSGQVRIEKITQIIRECRFGIHDLSRIELSKNSGLPRFNMPLELGLFLGAKAFGDSQQNNKNCLILDKQEYRYQKMLSDIAGQDISFHRNNKKKLIGVIRKWLNHYSKETIPGETAILERYNSFKAALPAMCESCDLKENELTYFDYLKFAGTWINQKDWQNKVDSSNSLNGDLFN